MLTSVNKRSTVIPMIVESGGGIAPHSAAYIRRLGRRAKGRGAVDRTKYGSARSSPKSYVTHHVQQMSKAAVMYDARAIRKQVTNLKQRHLGAAGAHAPHSARA